MLSTEIPPEIKDAAKLIDEWFKMQGVETWELMGICSRNHVDMLEKATRSGGGWDTRIRDSRLRIYEP